MSIFFKFWIHAYKLGRKQHIQTANNTLNDTLNDTFRKNDLLGILDEQVFYLILVISCQNLAYTCWDPKACRSRAKEEQRTEIRYIGGSLWQQEVQR